MGASVPTGSVMSHLYVQSEVVRDEQEVDNVWERQTRTETGTRNQMRKQKGYMCKEFRQRVKIRELPLTIEGTKLVGHERSTTRQQTKLEIPYLV